MVNLKVLKGRKQEIITYLNKIKEKIVGSVSDIQKDGIDAVIKLYENLKQDYKEFLGLKDSWKNANEQNARIIRDLNIKEQDLFLAVQNPLEGLANLVKKIETGIATYLSPNIFYDIEKEHIPKLANEFKEYFSKYNKKIKESSVKSVEDIKTLFEASEKAEYNDAVLNGMLASYIANA